MQFHWSPLHDRLTASTVMNDVNSALSGLVQTAVADLSGRLGVSAADIAVVSATLVRWPDRSLGCPQPGMVYPQVSVDGARIELTTGGAVYAYHQGGSRGPFLCAEPRPS
jgi:hypothetical protein